MRKKSAQGKTRRINAPLSEKLLIYDPRPLYKEEKYFVKKA